MVLMEGGVKIVKFVGESIEVIRISERRCFLGGRKLNSYSLLLYKAPKLLYIFRALTGIIPNEFDPLSSQASHRGS